MRRETSETEKPKEAEQESDEQRHTDDLPEEREEADQAGPEPPEITPEQLHETEQTEELPRHIQEQLEELADNMPNEQKDQAPEQETPTRNTEEEDTDEKTPSEIPTDKQEIQEDPPENQVAHAYEEEKIDTSQLTPDQTHRTTPEEAQIRLEATPENPPNEHEHPSTAEYRPPEAETTQANSDEERKLKPELQPNQSREVITEEKQRKLEELAGNVIEEKPDHPEAERELNHTERIGIKVLPEQQDPTLKNPANYREEIPKTEERMEQCNTETGLNHCVDLKPKQENDKGGEYYHWWQEPPGSFRQIKKDYLSDIILKKSVETKATSIEDLIIDKLGGTQAETIAYRKFLTGRTSALETTSIARFCRTFNIPHEELEKQDRLMDRTWPIPLKIPEMAMLASHVMNEGNMQRFFQGKGRHGPIWNYQLHYTNQDPVLHWYFQQQVEAVGGTASIPKPRKGGIESWTDTITARILHEAGVPFSPKTINQPRLNELYFRDTRVRKYHFSTTLAEEGYVILRIAPKDPFARLVVGWNRTIDITPELSQSHLKDYSSTKVIRIGELPHHLRTSLEKKEPRIMSQERALLCQFHPEIRWRLLYPDCIWRRERDGGFSMRWIFQVSNDSAVDILYKEYGMPQNTWKARRFDALYEVYSRLRGGRLTSQEIKEIEKVRRNYPPKIQPWWIKETMPEFFPEASWVKEEAEIAKIFSHRRVSHHDEA